MQNKSRFETCPCCEHNKLTPFPKHTAEYMPPADWKDFFYGKNSFLGPVSKCENCHFHFLENPSEHADKFYKSADISDYMNSENPRQDYFKKVKKDIEIMFPEISDVSNIVDFGCASGSWLAQWDQRYTRIGVEVNEDFREVLESKDIRMENSLEGVDLKTSSIISAFDFVEHVEDPRGFLEYLASGKNQASNFYVFGVPDMGRLAAKYLGTNYYLYCPMHFNYFDRISLGKLCVRVFPDHDVKIINSPIMYTNIDGILKWVLPKLNVGKLGAIPIPIGYRSNIIAILSPKA